FTDEDSTPGIDLRRIRIPVGRIEDADAWTAARAPGDPSLTQPAPYGSDIKWSPLQQRYFVSYLKTLTPQIQDPSDPAFRQPATTLCSDPTPAPAQPPPFPSGNEVVLPDGGRVAIWGGLLGDGLGHTLDHPDGSDPHTDLDLYFESYHRGFRNGAVTFDTDIAHASVTMHVVTSTPDIAVDGITDGQAGAIVVGRAAVGATKPIATFTVRNTGKARLDLGAISLPRGFTIVQGLPSSLQPGESAGFKVALDTSKAGTFSGRLGIA